MDLRECYARLGGNYDAVIGRLRKEERIVKFLGLFEEDENFSLLTDALEREDWTTAFRAAHSLKGVALNMAFTDLTRSASALTECLRSGAPTQDPGPLYAEVKADYDRAIAAVGALDRGDPA